MWIFTTSTLETQCNGNAENGNLFFLFWQQETISSNARNINDYQPYGIKTWKSWVYFPSPALEGTTATSTKH